MAHAYIVNIGETEAEMSMNIFHIFLNRIDLASDISGRFLYRKQKLIR